MTFYWSGEIILVIGMIEVRRYFSLPCWRIWWAYPCSCTIFEHSDNWSLLPLSTSRCSSWSARPAYTHTWRMPPRVPPHSYRTCLGRLGWGYHDTIHPNRILAVVNNCGKGLLWRFHSMNPSFYFHATTFPSVFHRCVCSVYMMVHNVIWLNVRKNW